MPRLDSFGCDGAWRAAFAASPHLPVGSSAAPVLGRVVEESRDALTVVLDGVELVCSLSGRLRHAAHDRLDVPVVGDFVVVAAPPPGSVGRGVVHGVLPRRSLLARKAAGRSSAPQPVVANCETALLVTSANADFTERRLERYAALAWESGAQPLVVVTKVDLVEDATGLLARAVEACPGAEVVGVSATTGAGLDALVALLVPGRTAALVGSSGVGKSTLVNRLLGVDAQRTKALRHDATGVHTTTSRRLLVLPSGALIVDTPGMREVGLTGDDGGVGAAFADVETLAGSCRFGDCAHETEPGCAVKTAIDAGSLDAERYASYRRLLREAAFQARKNDPSAKAAHRAQWRRRVADGETIRRLEGRQ